MFNPAEDDFVIEDRPQLIYALTEAAALEHVLMCQYLFAAASLKTDLAEFSGARKHHQVELVRYWKRKILEVAREEMQHLSMAVNMLVAVGGGANFARPPFPSENQYYKQRQPDGSMKGLPMTLAKFSGSADNPFAVIDRFIRFEQPRPVPGVTPAAMVPEPNVYDTVGELYEAIRGGFRRIPNVILDTQAQYAPTNEYRDRIFIRGRRDLAVVTSVTDAEAFIDEIVRHGEGMPGGQVDENAHYQVFVGIREAYQRELTNDPDFDPARPIVPNPATRAHSGGETVIDAAAGPLPVSLLHLFAGSYELMLMWLGQLYTRGGGTKPPALRAIETFAFFPYMTEVISPLAELMTLVPRASGAMERIGPSFEVTSNHFRIPSLDAMITLTEERLTELSAMARAVAQEASAAALPHVATRIDFIATTFRLLRDELKPRIDHDWPPPRSSWDPTYSEQADTLTFDLKRHAVVALRFEGVAQCRLATDPDGADVKRGITGNGFAIGDEPDLDRIIRFQPGGAVPRVETAPVGVFVVAATLQTIDLMPFSDRGQPLPELVGSAIDLVGAPVFEGRNHVVWEDGEPIDPFEIEVRTPAGDVFARRARGIPMNDMTPLQRRGAGRAPAVTRSEDAMLANLAVINRRAGTAIVTPLEYTENRIASLERRAATLTDGNDASGAERAALAFRIRSLREGLKRAGERDARPIRWIRYFFDASYRHLVSGAMRVNPGALGPTLELLPDSSWLASYRFGFFDTDAMTFVVRGLLHLPVRRV